MDNDFKQLVEKYKSELLRFNQEHQGERQSGVATPAVPQQPPIQTRATAPSTSSGEPSPTPAPPEPRDRPMSPPQPEPSARPDMPPEIPQMPQPPVSMPEIPQIPISQPEMPSVTPQSPEISTPAPDRATDDRGYIQIKTYTAREATPVADALVLVLKDGSLVYQTLTDEDGLSELIELETVSRELSQKIGNLQPFTPYDLQITANGYLPVRSMGVPIFGGVTSIENVALVPKPEFVGQSQNETFENTEPNL